MNIRLLLLAACLLALLLTGCASPVIKNLTRTHITKSNGSTPLRRNYDQLAKGMTQAQVVSLMGQPDRQHETQRDGFDFTVLTYREQDWRAIIVVGAHGLVVAHGSDDPDFGK